MSVKLKVKKKQKNKQKNGEKEQRSGRETRATEAEEITKKADYYKGKKRTRAKRLCVIKKKKNDNDDD